MSNHGQINHDLYKWLVNLQILPNSQKYKASGNFQLEFRLQQQLQSGYLIAKLLLNLATEKGITLNGPLLSSIKNSNTPAARVYNWNILSESLLKLGFNLPKQNQKEITSGNFDSLVLFLLDIQGKTNSKKLQKTNQSSSPPQQGLDIKKIHKYQEIQQSETVLQFILILISKWMGLTAKQAIATLSQSAKYLAHMIVKGIKNSFQQIIAFIDDARNRMDKIMYLLQKDAQKNMQFLLQIFKPSLISRESDVAKAGCSVFKSLIYESFKYNSKNLVYQILCKQGEGFDFMYMGLKRHPYLNSEITDFMYLLLRGTLKDFMDIQLKRTINNDQQYVKTIILMIEPLLLNKEAKEEIKSCGLLAQWEKSLDTVSSSKLKGKDSSSLSQETKYFYVQLMYILWMGYYKELQPNHLEQLLIKIAEELKKNTRNEVYNMRIPSLLKIFSLLDFLATNKNKLAALLYKKIIFLFVQNHNQDEMRQIVLENLTIIIKKFPTIPLQFLLQPMLKQLTNKQGTTYILNMYDFQFIIQLCKHPKMEEYYAITFLDYFIRLYIKSVIYSSLIFRVIEAITARFCESEQIREYCLKSTDVCLNNYGMLVMGKTKGNKASYANSKSQNKQEIIINNQKKSLIIELIKHFISLEHHEMTNQIKQKVATLFIDWYQNRSHYDKGLAAILMQIGDIEDILVEFKQKQIDNIRQKKVQSPLHSSQNQFDSKNTNSKDKNQSKLLKYQNYFDADEQNSPNLQDIGLGYKKKKNNLSKLQLVQSRSKHIKPDPKVLEDIQKIKQKWKLENSRAKIQQQNAKKEKTTKLNQKQLLQRNLSLGYAKLPELNNDQILFDFDTVKKKHLKDSLDLINIQAEQQRDSKSFSNIIERYEKYLKSLFAKYANKSAASNQDRQTNILSFTQIMRLLKDKQLIAKVPKIAINQVITTVNQKKRKQRNVLGGIEEQDFPNFILYYTDLLMKQDTINKKDEPFGMKAQKVILKMLEGQNNVKELFDPKIQKIKQDLQFNDKIQIPQEYKKVAETQVQLDYTIKNLDNGIHSSFIDCYEIVDGLIYEAMGLHIISPYTGFKQKFALIRKPMIAPHSKSVNQKLNRPGTQSIQASKLQLSKDILADSQNSFTKPLKKLSKNILKKKSQSQRNIGDESTKKEQQQERDKKREIHAKKLKQQILKLRDEKIKIEEQKKQKQKEDEQRKRKKEQIRKQYLEQNKRKVLQKKQQDERKIQEQKRLKSQHKDKRKAEVKAKQAQMLEKERKLIQQKKEKLAERVKVRQVKQKEKEKFSKSKSHDKLITEMKQIAADQKMKDLLIKSSMENGDIKTIIDKNKKNFEDLFQAYWNWQKKMIELKNLAQMLKDLQTTKYIPPKDIADVYKNVSKGQILGLQNFIQCIVKLSYRSTAIEQEIKQSEKKNNEQKDENKISPAQFQFMLKLLKMNYPNYKQTILKIKSQKQVK